MGEVAALRGGPVTSDARQAFLDAVAQSFDAYVKDTGAEPDAAIWVFGGVGQKTRDAWLARGRTAELGATGNFIASAATLLIKEMVNPG